MYSSSCDVCSMKVCKDKAAVGPLFWIAQGRQQAAQMYKPMKLLCSSSFIDQSVENVWPSLADAIISSDKNRFGLAFQSFRELPCGQSTSSKGSPSNLSDRVWNRQICE